jgi:hypothetical protein
VRKDPHVEANVQCKCGAVYNWDGWKLRCACASGLRPDPACAVHGLGRKAVQS